MKISSILAVAVTIASMATAPTHADTYPVRLITFVVPFSAGTATDSVARFLAESVSKELKTTIVVENKPGANGSIAARAVATGPTDGSVVFITTNSSHAANANLYRKLSYDPVKDFAPISRIMRIPLVLVVKPELQVKNVADLIAQARTRDLNYGAGNSAAQVGAELLAKSSGVRMTRIPYAGNNGAITDLIANRIDLVVADLTTALPQIDAKTITPLAVTSSTRVAQLPGVPTMEEAGVKDYEIIGWVAAFARAGTSPDLIKQLHRALVSAVASPEAARFFSSIGGEPFPSTPEELQAFVETETAKWANFVAVAGIEKQ
jgi:tripartite-type tricarboxylate transporter receptor subunit TctC